MSTTAEHLTENDSSTLRNKPASRRALRAQAKTELSQLTPAQLPGSRRVYLDAGDGIAVPCRAVTMSDQAQSEILLYDCSGAFGDETSVLDVRQGLPALRQAWIAARNDSTPVERQFCPKMRA